ncbi:unnamed protein product [Durusdinium trenchii]|uniref:Uncharacterized protein n=1 Tax=Durusdinium trenchii TaxID=1381693 RepID=A0ABP0M5H0_9DINO
MRSTGQRWRLAERAWRNMSMPSRADTQPMILRLLKPYQDDEVASFNTDTAAGLCCSKSLLERARRRQVLSPLVPAEAVLRAFPEATRAALLVLAEHTLSSAACGVAAAWAIRDKQLLASTSHAQGELRCFSLCLRPGDLVAMAADGQQRSDAMLLDVVDQQDSQTMLLRCELMESKEAWCPLRPDAPHPSWAKTIFNEYGTHE